MDPKHESIASTDVGDSIDARADSLMIAFLDEIARDIREGRHSGPTVEAYEAFCRAEAVRRDIPSPLG